MRLPKVDFFSFKKGLQNIMLLCKFLEIYEFVISVDFCYFVTVAAIRE